MVGGGDGDGRASRAAVGQRAEQRDAERGALSRVSARAHLVQQH